MNQSMRRLQRLEQQVSPVGAFPWHLDFGQWEVGQADKLLAMSSSDRGVAMGSVSDERLDEIIIHLRASIGQGAEQ